MNLIPYVAGFAALAIVVLALAIYRRSIASKGDELIHVAHGEAMVPQQEAMAQKLIVVDRWGKILTVLAVLYGLGLAAAYLYKGWLENTNYSG